MRTRDGKPPSGFEVAGADLKFVSAEARIEGNGIIVSSPEVPEPRHVRHAFRNNPTVNLVNRAEMPLLPFRSDRKPG